MDKILNIGIIGLGKLGSSLYKVIEDTTKHNLSYYDLNRLDKEYTYESLDEIVIGKDIIFICVSTPEPEGYDGSKYIHQELLMGFDYNYKSLDGILDRLGDSDSLVVISSTVSPTKIKSIFDREGGPNIVYNPFMFEGGNEYNSIREQKNVIIGTKNDSHLTLLNLYNQITPETTYNILSPLDASLLKMLHNSYVSLRISFVNSIQRLGDVIDLEPQKILNELKTFPIFNSPIFLNVGLPSGGPCIPRDSMVISGLDTHNDLFGDIVNERMNHTDWLSQKVLMYMDMTNKSGVTLCGLSYKKGVDNQSGSSALLLYNELKRMEVKCVIDEEDKSRLTVLLNTDHKPTTTHYDVWKDELIFIND